MTETIIGSYRGSKNRGKSNLEMFLFCKKSIDNPTNIKINI